MKCGVWVGSYVGVMQEFLGRIKLLEETNLVFVFYFTLGTSVTVGPSKRAAGLGGRGSGVRIWDCLGLDWLDLCPLLSSLLAISLIVEFKPIKDSRNSGIYKTGATKFNVFLEDVPVR